MPLLAWYILGITDSYFAVTLIGFFTMLPLLLLGLVGGVLADAIDRKRLLLLTQSANLVVSAGMLLALVSGQHEIWYAYVVSLSVGVGWAMEMPTRRSLIHDMMGPANLTNGIALDSMAMSASIATGPALAGGMISVADVTGGYVVVALLYLASLVLLTRIRVPPPRRRRTTLRSVGSDVLDGLRSITENRPLLAVVLITVMMNLMLFPYMHLAPVIAKNVLEVGPTLMGLLQSAGGLGSFLGAIGVASLTGVRRHGWFFMGGSLIALLCLLVFANSLNYLVSVASLFVLGLGVAGFSTMQATLTLLVSREGMRGKALGLVTLAIGTAPLGAVSVGLVADAAGPAYALTVHAGLGILVLVLIGATIPSIRSQTTGDT